ncbi:MAG: FixH family protein [Deltaproteobacteria bacterium]|nr:FixH family protein [Deltaproteobacteria bacterium]
MLVLMAAKPGSAVDLVKQEGEIRWAVRSDPLQVREGDRVRYTVRISDGNDRPVDRANLRLIGTMPDGMVVRATVARTTEAGVYEATVIFPMAGAWRMELSARGDAKTASFVFTETVGAR